MRSLIVALCLPTCLVAQQDSTYSPELLTSVRLGSNPAVVSQTLEARGFRSRGTVPTPAGQQIVFAGTIDKRPVEVIAWFGSPARGSRLINYTVNFPANNEAELHEAYAWLYRRAVAARCEPELLPDYRVQLDSILRERTIGIPPATHVSTARPVLPGGTAFQDGNLDWPEPVWLSPDGGYGSRLSASRLAEGALAPFQVSLWTSTVFTVEGLPTTCDDTRAYRLAEKSARAARVNASDTLLVAILSGVSGRVDTLRMPSVPKGEMVREVLLTFPRGTRIEYSFQADSGHEPAQVLAGDTEVPARGSFVLQSLTILAAAARPVMAPESKKLFDLYREQLTSPDPLAVFIEIECEIERLEEVYSDRAAELIAQAKEFAVHPDRDRKALIRIDNALGGKMFGGCDADRKQRP